MRKVYRLIRQLGMTSKYKGYYYVAEAVMMSMELQDYPIKITKDIYPYLAKKFKSTPVNIEHDIRTVINVCWTANKETMDRIAGYPLRYRPTNSEFVDMLAYYLIQTELDAEDAIEEAKKNLTACQIQSMFLKKFRTAESHEISGCLSRRNVSEEIPVVQNNSLFLY